MSASKDYFLQMEEKQCMMWIHQQYGIDVYPDEKTELWDELYAE